MLGILNFMQKDKLADALAVDVNEINSSEEQEHVQKEEEDDEEEDSVHEQEDIKELLFDRKRSNASQGSGSQRSKHSNSPYSSQKSLGLEMSLGIRAKVKPKSRGSAKSISDRKHS